MLKTKVERFYREIQQFVLIPNGMDVSLILNMLENNRAWTMPEFVEGCSTGRNEICAVMKDGKLDPDGDSIVIGWIEEPSTNDVDETYSVLR